MSSISIEEARRLQNSYAAKVEIVPLKAEPAFIAGVDAAFSETRVYAAACLFAAPGFEFLEEATAAVNLDFPYIPGYLSFREGRALIEAVRRLSKTPDVILVDGQGIAHPRRIGIASHIGVLLDIPTIGCAKSRLIGEFREPGRKKGDRSPLLYKDQPVGAVLRTRAGVRPVFISPGHRVDFENAVAVVLASSGRYRIPEPLRRADFLSKKMKAASVGRFSRKP